MSRLIEYLRTIGGIGFVAAASILGLAILSFALIIIAVVILHPRGYYCAEIVNRSSEKVDLITLSGGGADATLGDLAPSAGLRHCFQTGPEGALFLSFRQDGQHHKATVDGYITSGTGGEAVVEINDFGRVSVEKGQIVLGLDAR